MYILGTLLTTLAYVFSIIVNVYTFIVIGAVIISWVNPDPHNPIVRFLRQVTEPVFMRVRRFLPAALFRTGLDFTPLIVLILLVIFERFVLNILAHYGQRIAAGL